MATVLACGRARRTAGDREAETAIDGASPQFGVEGMTVLRYWGAALSCRSAASLWGLLPIAGGSVDVSISGDGGRRRRQGIRLHRSPSLLPADVTLRRGIPVTRPTRTIADLRRGMTSSGRPGLISPKELRRAVRQANVLGLPIGDDDRRDRTRSDLERDFLRLCRRHRLPVPKVNVRIGPHLVDFLWRDRKVVVETDGYVYHRGRVAFEDDRARDLDLRGLGYEVLRIADRQIDDEPNRIAAALRSRFASVESAEAETRQAAP
jgi:very-short-patch-repair endonuclease